MSVASLQTMSRRNMLAASIAAPTVGGLGATISHGVQHDPVLAKAGEWLSERQRLEEMIRQWQRLEARLFRRARQLGIEIEAAFNRPSQDTQTMRILDERMEIAHVTLTSLAKQVSSTRASSPEGSLAKIELGVHVQGRYNWQDYALQLVEGGVADLKALDNRG